MSGVVPGRRRPALPPRRSRRTGLLAAVDQLADGVIVRALYGSRCIQCGSRIRTSRYRVVVDRKRGPVLLHRRCVRPLRLTASGRAWRDLIVGVAVSFAIGWAVVGLVVLAGHP